MAPGLNRSGLVVAVPRCSGATVRTGGGVLSAWGALASVRLRLSEGDGLATIESRLFGLVEFALGGTTSRSDLVLERGVALLVELRDRVGGRSTAEVRLLELRGACSRLEGPLTTLRGVTRDTLGGFRSEGDLSDVDARGLDDNEGTEALGRAADRTGAEARCRDDELTGLLARLRVGAFDCTLVRGLDDTRAVDLGREDRALVRAALVRLGGPATDSLIVQERMIAATMAADQ